MRIEVICEGKNLISSDMRRLATVAYDKYAFKYYQLINAIPEDAMMYGNRVTVILHCIDICLKLSEEMAKEDPRLSGFYFFVDKYTDIYLGCLNAKGFKLYKKGNGYED